MNCPYCSYNIEEDDLPFNCDVGVVFECKNCHNICEVDCEEMLDGDGYDWWYKFLIKHHP